MPQVGKVFEAGPFILRLTRGLQGANELVRKSLENRAPELREAIYNDAPYDPEEDGKPHLEDSVYAEVDEDGKGITCGTRGIAYAAKQEVTNEYNHPVKGKAHYVEENLWETAQKVKQDLAECLPQLFVGESRIAGRGK